MTQKTSNATLAGAMRVLAVEIESGDGVANAAIAEASERLDELAGIAAEMLAMLPHNAVPTGRPACAIANRLRSLGIERDTR